VRNGRRASIAEKLTEGDEERRIVAPAYSRYPSRFAGGSGIVIAVASTRCRVPARTNATQNSSSARTTHRRRTSTPAADDER